MVIKTLRRSSSNSLGLRSTTSSRRRMWFRLGLSLCQRFRLMGTSGLSQFASGRVRTDTVWGFVTVPNPDLANYQLVAISLQLHPCHKNTWYGKIYGEIILVTFISMKKTMLYKIVTSESSHRHLKTQYIMNIQGSFLKGPPPPPTTPQAGSTTNGLVVTSRPQPVVCPHR